MQGLRQLQDGLICHAVKQIIRLGVKKDGAADGVIPEVVMRHAPQRGFNTAQHNWDGLFKIMPDEVGVSDHRAVGTAGVLTAGCVIIRAALFLAGGVIGNHRIHAAAGDTPEQARLAQAGNIQRMM